MPHSLHRLVWLALFAVLAANPLRAADFAKDIQPILKAQCYSCHDGRKQQASLRLDLRARAFKGGESGDAAIVKGMPAESPLYQRVSSKDKDIRMPPEGPGLSTQELELVRQWIEAGAEWPDALAGDEHANRKHWAFQPPQRPEPPGDASKWSRNAIDRFVIDRLSKEHLKPSPEADKATLLRRLSLDLIGLPPTIEEIDDFLTDKSGDAYARQVERLLASPHYGERWGRLWLDAARYADSDGFEKDKPRFVWFYRDWVVSALNRDLPYDQFITQQLAGDLLPNATQDQVVATGFLRNSMINEEGGVDPEQFRMEAMFDRMDAIGKSMLGLTIQCAQCHDHKYDPISQADYYRLFAFLNNSAEGSTSVYTPAQLQLRADILRKTSEIESRLKHTTPDWSERMAAWEKTLEAEPKWTVARPSLDSSGGQKHYLLDDGSILAQGYATTKSTYDFAATIPGVPKITAMRLELLNDANLPMGGPGRAVTGLCALTEFSVDLKQGQEKPAKVKFAKAMSDAESAEAPLDAMFHDKSDKKRTTGPVAFAIDGNPLTAWSIDIGHGRSNVPRTATFLPESPVENADGALITFHLAQNHGGWNSDDNQTNNLGRFRLSVTGDPISNRDALPTAVREVLRIPVDQRSPAQVDVVFGYWRTLVPEWKADNDEIETLWKLHPQPSSQLVLRERDEPRMTHMLKRGDFLKPGDRVQAGLPDWLNPPTADADHSRLSLAKWMTSRQSPTTARSIVNRIWQGYFGTGLVATSEDFGTQADQPSHRELLDWLAVELMEPTAGPSEATPAPWSLKHIHRLIANSATYRQSSKVSPELAAIDPYNRLLARGARFRVDAEVVRDVCLAASGLLNREVGGPSVHPPLPEFMLQPPVSYGPKTWEEEKGPERYRRAIYTFRFRSIPYPVLQAFDAPNGDFSCVRRGRSNTPLQALMTLNEPIFMECARALAQTMLAGAPDTRSRLNLGFLRCTGRLPTEREKQALLELLNSEMTAFAGDDKRAWETAANDPANPPALPPGVTPQDAAAWTAVARVLLNLDETITRE